jgi:histone-lysine N-methyltransferase SETMAR
MATFGWERFNHPPYSPDLAPSDFHMFLHLKTFLGGRRFHDDNEVKEAVNTWFASQAASFYDATTCASTMVETMSKCSVPYIHQMAL